VYRDIRSGSFAPTDDGDERNLVDVAASAPSMPSAVVHDAAAHDAIVNTSLQQMMAAPETADVTQYLLFPMLVGRNLEFNAVNGSSRHQLRKIGQTFGHVSRTRLIALTAHINGQSTRKYLPSIDELYRALGHVTAHSGRIGDTEKHAA
jgi:hypothetical protein